MPKFEVHIPATARNGLSFTFRVDADGWTAALKAGMARLGPHADGERGQNMLVDVQDDNSLHVTDAETGRVFQIRELSEAEAATVPVKRGPGQAAGFSPAAETIIESRSSLPEHIQRELEAAERADQEKREEARRKRDDQTTPGRPLPKVELPRDAAKTEEEMRALFAPRPAARRGTPAPLGKPSSRTSSAPPVDEPITRVQRRVKPPPEAYPTGPRRMPSTPSSPAQPQAPSNPRATPVSSPSAASGNLMLRGESSSRRGAKPRNRPDMEVVEVERPFRPVTGTIGRIPAARNDQEIEALLSEVFERVQEVYAYDDPTQALYFLLDLALEKIPCDAGSVLEADDATGDLRFTAARGPKAAELLQANLVVPSGEGIAGFCAHEGVSVALSDVQKDPRYYAEVSRRVDYETRSVLASPMMTHGRTFGCMQLINRKDSPLFAVHELGLLSYIAHQGALYLNALA